MDNSLMLMTCKRCGKKTLMKNMRLTSDGVSMVCVDCINKETALRKPAQTPHLVAAAKKTGPKEKMITYYCQDCKYKFDRKASAQITKCPYCGSSGSLVPETKLASDKILDEALDRKYDF